jgi:hypothetical protein
VHPKLLYIFMHWHKATSTKPREEANSQRSPPGGGGGRRRRSGRRGGGAAARGAGTYAGMAGGGAGGEGAGGAPRTVDGAIETRAAARVTLTTFTSSSSSLTATELSTLRGV